MDNFKITPISRQDMDDRFGKELRTDIGNCFINVDGHYFMQREHDVLHVNKNIINSVHNSIIDLTVMSEVSKEEFENEVREVIFNLDIYKYSAPIG